MPIRSRRSGGLPLATGQTTQYSSELDDGNYKKGMAKSFTVLDAGAYSGTTNVDLAHYAGGAGAIAFDNTAKTITDTGNGLAMFKTDDVILTDAPNNPGPFTITTGNVAGTITCTGATFVTETPAGAITISKREAKNNNCVQDNNTYCMWSRYVSSLMGTASDGQMPWTGQLYDIFAYAAAANTASLAGYTDWRVANIYELLTLPDYSIANRTPDATAFPSWNSPVWSSTTWKALTTSAAALRGSGSANSVLDVAKTTDYYVMLVRGG